MTRFSNTTGETVNTDLATQTWRSVAKQKPPPQGLLFEVDPPNLQTPYRDPCGIFFVVAHPRDPHTPTTAKVLTRKCAKEWLTLNGHEIPDFLINTDHDSTEMNPHSITPKGH